MTTPKRQSARVPWQHPITIVPATAPGTRNVVEIGPGNGDYLLHLAAANPDWHCVGVELKISRFETIARRVAAANLSNVTIINGNAGDVLPQLAEQGPIHALYILFSDPWPKRRHAHHRLMQPAFVRACADALALDGELWFTTDDEPYALATATLIAAHPELQSTCTPTLCINPPDLFPSFFARKWQVAGRVITTQHYVKSPKGIICSSVNSSNGNRARIRISSPRAPVAKRSSSIR